MDTDALKWEDYCMGIALLTAKQSEDPNTKVGACIVNIDQKEILGTGYNSMPKRCTRIQLPWNRDGSNELDKKYLYVCHAAMNAIMNCRKRDLKGCTMYISLLPCNECAKLIIEAGIENVFYFQNKYDQGDRIKAAQKLFDSAGIYCNKHSSKLEILGQLAKDQEVDMEIDSNDLENV